MAVRIDDLLFAEPANLGLKENSLRVGSRTKRPPRLLERDAQVAHQGAGGGVALVGDQHWAKRSRGLATCAQYCPTIPAVRACPAWPSS